MVGPMSTEVDKLYAQGYKDGSARRVYPYQVAAMLLELEVSKVEDNG